MPQSALKAVDFPSAVNDEPTIDQKRIVARLSSRWFLQGLTLVKTFGGNQVVKGVDLSFDKGAFVTLLGPSG